MAHRPLHEFEPVQPVAKEAAGVAGSVVSDTAQEAAVQGRAIAFGPAMRIRDRTVLPLETGNGDRVLYGGWSGIAIRIDHGVRPVRKGAANPGVIG